MKTLQKRSSVLLLKSTIFLALAFWRKCIRELYNLNDYAEAIQPEIEHAIKVKFKDVIVGE